MKTTPLLLSLIEDQERRLKKARKKLSKLTDSLTGLESAVADLKTRVDAADAANAGKDAQITTLQSENDDAATTITDLTAQITAIEAGTSPATSAATPGP